MTHVLRALAVCVALVGCGGSRPIVDDICYRDCHRECESRQATSQPIDCDKRCADACKGVRREKQPRYEENVPNTIANPGCQCIEVGRDLSCRRTWCPNTR